MKYPLIVFDWDGTIIDSPNAIVDCILEAARDAGLRVPERERAAHTIGLGLDQALRHAVPDLPAERTAEFVAHYRRHFRARQDSLRLFGGMRELLDELSGKHALAIATGKSRRGLERALQSTGIGSCFSASRCADETDPKPHPAMLLDLMHELNFSKNQVLMIGDTSHDLEMARAAGVDALAVSYGAHPEEGLRACEPLACVSSVRDLKEWLTTNA